MNTPSPDFPAALRSRFLIDFRITELLGKPVLYMNDNHGMQPTNRLNIALTNRSGSPISFGPADSEHFRLTFRKGVLSAKTLSLLGGGNWQNLEINQPWQVKLSSDPASDMLAFKCSDPQKAFPKQSGLFVPNQTLTLILLNISADGMGGERATQVLFTPLALTPAFAPEGLPGKRRQQMYIQNQINDSPAPLMIYPASTPNFTNDGVTRNRLSLTVMRQFRPLPINPRSSPAPTSLTFSFETSSGAGRLPLTDAYNAVKIICTTSSANWHLVDQSCRQGQTPEFSFMTDSTALAAGEQIHVDFTEIVSTSSARQANIYLRYKNIPGYPGDKIVLVVNTIK